MIELQKFVKVLVFVSCLVYGIHSLKPVPRNNEGCEFLCDNGNCIDGRYACDGIADCRDGSDETEVLCGIIKCPSYEFQCDYGPCINKSKVCNKAADCADNSDERAANCINDPRYRQCTKFEYECDNGQCIDTILVCDGLHHCNDGSDERSCHDINMNDDSYCFIPEQPKYGFYRFFEGMRRDVAKHGDKMELICGGKSFSSGPGIFYCLNGDWKPPLNNSVCELDYSRFDCIMPRQPRYGSYYLNSLDRNKNGDFAKNGSTLFLLCGNGVSFFDANQFYCLNGVWRPPLNDTCIRECPLISSTSTYEISCKYNGKTIDCKEAVKGAIAERICIPLYTANSSDNSSFAVCRADGSWSQSFKPCVPANINSACLLPSLPNGKYKDVDEHTYLENVYVQSQKVVQTVCDPGYIPTQSPLFYCFEGKWNPPLGRDNCLRTCRSLYPTDSYTVTCQLNGQDVNCTSPIEKTIAKVYCQPYFKEVNHPIPLCQNGEWDPPPVPCQPVCGRKIVNVQTLVIGGNHTIPGEYPWIVAIYRQKGDAYEQICSGSLISRFFVLSAAHCFADRNGVAFNKSIFALVAGKYHRDFYKNENGTQIRKISELHFPRNFRGAIQSYRDDIALVKVDEKFELSERVQLVCVDWSNLYEDHDFRDKNPGVVAGWGRTQEGSTPAETLMKLVVPYRSLSLCRRHLDMAFQNRFLFSDKFCAGYISKGMNVCKGDSGGGLFFRSQTDTYFIRGIVSLTATSTGGCNSNQYALYTKVSKYLQWLKHKTLMKI